MPALATRQDGIISHGQLREIGFTDSEIRGLVRRGYLHRIHRGVYAVGHRNLTPRAHLFAAQLALGPDSFLSHRTAAALWGLREIATKQIEVTTVAAGTHKREGLIVHRTDKSPHPSEIRVVPPLRYSSALRVLIELADREKDQELERMFTVAIRKNMLDVHKLEWAFERHARRPGLAKLKRVADPYRPRPDGKSGLERAFDRGLVHHPEIPEPQQNIYIGGWEIDRYWPPERVALELDGRPWHIAVREMERDRLKDIKLQLLEVKPMRVTDSRFEHDPAGVYADLLALLELGRRLR
jgi:Transcriptional regulator, AbiEi antitoxin